MPAPLTAWPAARRRAIAAAAEAAARMTLQIEDCALAAAAGRVLAADVYLDRDQPPFDRSTRDGFAVRAADVARVPARLRRVGEVRAGQEFDGRVGAGECVAIYTGAPLPDGADSVVMVEDTRAEGDAIEISRAVAAPGHNLVPRGAEGRRGDLALARGTRLDARQLALVASVGLAHVAVRAAPRVAIVSTGDEIVPIETVPGPRQIRNSNGAMLAAQVRSAGGEPIAAPRAPDQAAALEAALAAAFDGADCVVITGGVSMGQYDLVEPTLARLGATTLLDGVAIRPGKPVVFGHARGKLWFGLPGNPVSSMVTFELLVRPALAVLGGAPAPVTPLREVTLDEAWSSKKGLPLALFLPARLVADDAGRPRARLLASQGSGDLVGLAAADGWVVVPEGATALAASQPVGFLPGP
jgi:molybdopterin molybdotransferase